MKDEENVVDSRQMCYETFDARTAFRLTFWNLRQTNDTSEVYGAPTKFVGRREKIFFLQNERAFDFLKL